MVLLNKKPPPFGSGPSISVLVDVSEAEARHATNAVVGYRVRKTFAQPACGDVSNGKAGAVSGPNTSPGEPSG